MSSDSVSVHEGWRSVRFCCVSVGILWLPAGQCFETGSGLRQCYGSVLAGHHLDMSDLFVSMSMSVYTSLHLLHHLY